VSPKDLELDADLPLGARKTERGVSAELARSSRFVSSMRKSRCVDCRASSIAFSVGAARVQKA
jgi:hypothetical protein